MPFLSRDDTRIFYSVHGAGSPLVLLHGWCCDGSDWAWLVPDLARQHRVIVMDARGHGHSGPSVDYSFDTMVGDVVALLEELAPDGAVLSGHSLGGVVATGVALHRPDLVRALVPIDPAYGHAAEFAEKLAGLTAFLSTMPGNAPEVVTEAFGAWMGEEAPGFLRTQLLRRVSGMDAAVVAGAFNGLAQANFFARDAAAEKLALRQCPVLAIFTTEDTAFWERSLLPGTHSRVEIFDGLGHWIHIERADELGAMMLEWMEALPAT